MTYRVVGGLENADRIMNDVFWVGVYPGLDRDQLNYVVENIRKAGASRIAAAPA